MSGLLIVSAAVTAAIAAMLKPESSADWFTVALGVLSLPGFYLAWASYRDDRSDGRRVPTLAEVADQLASAVRVQWTTEAELRRLNDPHPLPVSWQPAPADLVDGWEALVRLAVTGAGRPHVSADPVERGWADGPAGLAGSDGDLVDVLARVPTGRLVVLGEPGAGKTMLLVRLVLDLLACREQGGPVPVLVPLASWDPAGAHLYEWLAGRLAIDYPGLAGPAPDDRKRTRARALLDDGLILLLLDGLDEIPDAVRSKALARLNDALRPGQRLVVTSRVKPYRDAVRPPGEVQIRLTGAAGVELRPLRADDVADYLRGSAGGPVAADRWNPVLATLTASPASPASQALTTPLMASLARVVYNPRPDEPATTVGLSPIELLDPVRFSTRTDVERHLFDGFIPASYRPHPDRPCPWAAEQSKRWLSFLAGYLENQSGDNIDLSWWKIQYTISGPLAGLVVGLITGIVCGLAALLGSNIGIGMGIGVLCGLGVAFMVRFAHRSAGGYGKTRGIVGGISGGLLGALSAGLLSKLGIGLADGVTGALAIGLGSGIGVGSIAGFVSGAAGGFVGGLAGGLVDSLWSGVTAGIVNGLAIGLTTGLAVGLAGRRRPARGLRWSRTGIVGALVVALAVGLAVGLTVRPMVGLLVGLAAGLLEAPVVGLTDAPANLTAAVRPPEVLARDRLTFLVTVISVGLMTGILAGLIVGLAVVRESNAEVGFIVIVKNGLWVGLAGGLTVGLGVGFFRAAWGSFALARCWLALRRQLPWRLMGFLADAHQQRGLLRQVGGSYQFRHVELQRHLASRGQ
ncbi:NACHT domain-containing protein [Frankia sp. QA3]|uniref:NACHT domain-containing protein n=1 Tax=Frankia sp. QA3 TaxID=710111 RepID=UPI000269BE14|nr:NACHT domain-containing protein [Frankia sp. QA3]EIV91417.1 putative NTPase (NACHT family) [Frankia sp. QA3]